MPSCSVPGCSNRQKKGVKMFMARFPSDPNRKELWIKSISSIVKYNWQPSIHSVVCEAHFENDMWEKERVDGKRKLKLKAVPTVFPGQSKGSESQITKVQTNESLESQLGETCDTSAVDEEKSSTSNTPADLNACEKIPQSPELTLPANLFTTINPNRMDNEKKEGEVEFLKKRLEEANRKLELAQKLFDRNERSRIQLKKQNKKLAAINKKLMDSQGCFELAIKKMLNDDQVRVLANRSSRGFQWSNDTIKKALRLKLSCGSSGYEELRAQNIPLPSARTLRRKVETMQFEDIAENIIEIIADEEYIRDRDCVINKISIAPETREKND